MFKIGLEDKLFSDIESSLPDGIVKNRVIYLLKWYRKKAQLYKFLTYAGTSASIMLPAALALLNSLPLGPCLTYNCVKKLQIILPILSSAGAAFYAFLQCKDNWIRYRTAVEQIKMEAVGYIVRCGDDPPAADSDGQAFLERIEEISTAEFAEWRRNRLEAAPVLNENHDTGNNQPENLNFMKPELASGCHGAEGDS